MIAAGFVASLSGCGAARPMKFYTLEAPPTGTQATVTQYPVELMVGRLHASRLLHDDRIVYGISAVEMGVYNGHRWAEPPPGMIETMLIQQLRATGQYKSVQRLAGAARGEYIVRGRLISLEELDQPSGIVARFGLQLDLFQIKTGTVVWSQTYEHDEPVAKKTVNDVVEALQRNVQTGLSQLTAELGQYFASQAAK
jgi:ABC-type uncharacterized transport system auxiliary subunit